MRSNVNENIKICILCKTLMPQPSISNSQTQPAASCFLRQRKFVTPLSLASVVFLIFDLTCTIIKVCCIISGQVCVLCAVRFQLTRVPLRVAEQLYPLWPLCQPRHLSCVQGELHGGGAAVAVSVLR